MKNTTKKEINKTIADMVSNFLYYDRREDEDLPIGAIEEAIDRGEITQVEIRAKFALCLQHGLGGDE